MYFSKLELHNYGIYRGTHEMNLSDGAGQRNITLVGGLNGRGKTTFHDAILLALYGKQAYKYIQEKARSYDRFLLERINSYSADHEAYVAITMVLEDTSVLRIQRSWLLKNGRVLQSVSAEKNGIPDDVLANSWEYYVEEILPFGIARFFFFNNEKLTQLADDVSFEQIKGSIKSAIGVSTIEKAIDHLDEVIRRKKDAIISFENSAIKQSYQEAEEDIKKVEEEIAHVNHRVQELDGQRQVLTDQLSDREKEFWASGGNLGLDRDAIKAEKDKITMEAEATRGEIVRLASDPSTPLYLCKDLLYRAYDSESKLQASRASHYSDAMLAQLCQRIMTRLSEEGLSSDTLDIVLSVVKDEVDRRLSPEDEEKRIPLSPTSMALLEELIVTNLQTLPRRIEELLHNVEAQENRLMSLDAHLEVTDDKTMAMKLYEALRELEQQKALADGEYEKQSNTLRFLERQNELLKSKRTSLLKELASQENVNDDNARVVRYAAMSIEVLKQFKVRLQEEKLANLSIATTQCFRQLVEKNSLISKIHIDPKTLDIQLLRSDGSELSKSQLSAGEQQMFAISVIWALALTSGYKAPVVIDTPMARLDSSHRTNFVKKYLPAASSQVVVLSTDEEVVGGYLDLIRKNVLNSYTLLYHENGQYTSIVPGYFGEALS